MFTVELRDAMAASIRLCVPFVACLDVNCDKVVFFADPGETCQLRSKRSFTVSGWGGSTDREFTIRDRLGCKEMLSFEKSVSASLFPTSEVWRDSTSKTDYIEGVENIIDHLHYHGGKVVISRTITDEAEVDWIKVAERYFQLHDEAFRYIYFTPKHGFWVGASPELLLATDKDRFETMALAGTRSIDNDGRQWSGKDIAEQAIVRNYIVDRLYDLGLNPECGETETLTTGNIQHLCTTISGKIESCSPVDILRSLNPTPALAGYPLAGALEQIIMTERHPRRCYGGFVAIDYEDNFKAFVNLRCVNFSSRGWCMYVGGGIMPMSDAENEWAETEAKSLLLKNIICDSVI